MATNDYVLTSRYVAETGYDASILASKGTIAKRLNDLESDMTAAGIRMDSIESSLDTKIDGVDTRLAEYIVRNDILVAELKAMVEALEAIFSATAEVGQYLKVSAVDENGKITAVEAVSAPAEYKLPYTASELEEKLGQI